MIVITNEENLTSSPYVEKIFHGYTTSAGSTIRPAEQSWHMVVARAQKQSQVMVVGPLPTAGVVTWQEGGEILWIKFRLGTYMPHLPAKHFLNQETPLPSASDRAFWLQGAAWQFPKFDEVDTFVDRLVRQEILVRDPLVSAVLQEQPVSAAERTIRHRFLQTTGLTQSQIRQIERAQQAAALLGSGVSILDTVFDLGYFDQAHLTRSLKRWIGYTPAEFIRLHTPAAALTQESR